MLVVRIFFCVFVDDESVGYRLIAINGLFSSIFGSDFFFP